MSDLIKRQDAIDAIMDLPNCYNGFSDTYDKAYIIGTLEEVPSAVDCKKCIFKPFKNVPSAQRKGEWISVTNGRGGFECNQCHCYAPSYQNGDDWLTDFCPNCGAYMRGEEE